MPGLPEGQAGGDEFDELADSPRYNWRSQLAAAKVRRKNTNAAAIVIQVMQMGVWHVRYILSICTSYSDT